MIHLDFTALTHIYNKLIQTHVYINYKKFIIKNELLILPIDFIKSETFYTNIQTLESLMIYRVY